MKSTLSQIRKAITALIGAVLTWYGVVLTQPHITRGDWYALAIATATGLGVYGIPNDPAPPKL